MRPSMPRGYGAAAARLTPDQKVGSSNLPAAANAALLRRADKCREMVAGVPLRGATCTCSSLGARFRESSVVRRHSKFQPHKRPTVGKTPPFPGTSAGAALATAVLLGAAIPCASREGTTLAWHHLVSSRTVSIYRHVRCRSAVIRSMRSESFASFCPAGPPSESHGGAGQAVRPLRPASLRASGLQPMR